MSRTVKRALVVTSAVSALTALFMVGCSVAPRAFGWKAPTDAATISALEVVGHLAAPEIVESSGLTPSATRPGVYWTHNDSGNEPTLFAVESTGRLISSLRLLDARNTDWEAIAAGPCPSGSCLFVGDVGDNFARRAHVTVYRVPEPLAGDTSLRVSERLDVRYADGPRDVEAMYVAPDSSLWFLTKRPLYRLFPTRSPARLYRVPADAWRQGGMATATRVGTLPIIPGNFSARDWITDAALSPTASDGTRRLAVLTYGIVHVFQADTLSGRPGARLGRCALTMAERDAEAIAWLPDGRLLITNEGRGSRLHAGRCP